MVVRGFGIAALLIGSVMLAQALVPSEPTSPPPAAAQTASSSSSTPSPGVLGSAAPPAIGPIPDGFRVRVPRLRIDLPIAEGVIERDIEQQRTPAGFAFHLPGTAIPGQPGNAYLYSHARTGMFLALWDARVGDEVTIATPDGRTLAYVIAEIRPRVAPNDVSVAQPSPDERVTLQTSTGPDPSDPRFVVIALPRP